MLGRRDIGESRRHVAVRALVPATIAQKRAPQPSSDAGEAQVAEIDFFGERDEEYHLGANRFGAKAKSSGRLSTNNIWGKSTKPHALTA
jgi:hypothetical protein